MILNRSIWAVLATGVLGASLAYTVVARTADTHQAAISTWLTQDRAALVDIARTAKLAEMCKASKAALDRDQLEAALQQRVGARKPMDREYAAIAIRQGETEALVDFKAGPRPACEALGPADLHTVANYLSGRTTLRTASATRPPSSSALP